MKGTLSFITFTSIVSFGLLLSWKSIPNQEGYFEAAWNLSHGNFSKIILSPGITPLNYLTVITLERVFHLSIANAWKIMDLFFGGLLGVFLVNQYWRVQKSSHLKEYLIPIVILLSSFGFIYPLTSMTGEGPALFFALMGVHHWSKRSFILGVIFFMLSFLSKYTIYLIGPGIVIWTLLQIKSLPQRKYKELIVAGIFFLSLFFIYHSIKNWGDIHLQGAYSTGASVSKIVNNLFPFLGALLIGAPIATIATLFSFPVTSIFFLSAASALFMLTRHYFYWHYPLQIIPFCLYYLFNNPHSKKILTMQFILLQLLSAVLLIKLIPLQAGALTLFPTHMTYTESRAIEEIIKKDYHGGKIGYYLNRSFDEPFPVYEISYMEPTWNFVIEDTEYVVLPKTRGIPPILAHFSQCRYLFYTQINNTIIYKVFCNQKSI